MTLLFPSIAYGETMDDLVKRDGIHYKKFSDVPFTGKVTGKSQGSLKNGKRVGPWVTYHDNGQLESKHNYEDGIRHGPWVDYWKSGKLKFKRTYKDGKKVGPWVGYNADGTVWDAFTGTFKNDVKVK